MTGPRATMCIERARTLSWCARRTYRLQIVCKTRRKAQYLRQIYMIAPIELLLAAQGCWLPLKPSNPALMQGLRGLDLNNGRNPPMPRFWGGPQTNRTCVAWTFREPSAKSVAVFGRSRSYTCVRGQNPNPETRAVAVQPVAHRRRIRRRRQRTRGYSTKHHSTSEGATGATGAAHPVRSAADRTRNRTRPHQSPAMKPSTTNRPV
jgi:hypothetical protein